MNNINIKSTNNILNKTDEFITNINLGDLGLIPKQEINEIEKCIKGKNL